MSGLAWSQNGPFTMISGEALLADRLVLISSSTLMYTDGGQEPVGITKEVVANGVIVACELLDGNIRKVTGSKSITAGSAIYVDTDGKVTDSASGKQIGILAEAITGDGGKAAAWIWGPRGGNDVFASDSAETFRIQDHFTSGAVEDGFKFSETADKAIWLKTTTGSGADVCEVINDGPGGILQLTSNSTSNDREELQMNGSSVKLAVGKKIFFDCSVALLDVDKCDFFIGLAGVDTSFFVGVNERVGFEQLHDGSIDALVEEAGTENLADTNVDIADCATVSVFATKKVRLSFFWDGVDTVYFFVNGVLTNTMVDNNTTILIPDGVVMTPTFGINTYTGASAVQTLFLDYIDIQGEV